MATAAARVSVMRRISSGRTCRSSAITALNAAMVTARHESAVQVWAETAPANPGTMKRCNCDHIVPHTSMQPAHAACHKGNWRRREKANVVL